MHSVRIFDLYEAGHNCCVLAACAGRLWRRFNLGICNSSVGIACGQFGESERHDEQLVFAGERSHWRSEPTSNISTSPLHG
jgi:hypothetical protein